MDVDFAGLAELTRRVRSMGDTQGMEKKALEAGAKHVQKELEKVAPMRTGTLKANILMSDIENGKIDIGTHSTGLGFHGFFLEYGTSKMPARPWARLAWESNKRKVKEIMADELRKGLRL